MRNRPDTPVRECPADPASLSIQPAFPASARIRRFLTFCRIF